MSRSWRLNTGTDSRNGLCGAALLLSGWLLLGCGSGVPAEKDALFGDGGLTSDWPHVGQSIGGQRYSPLTQINRDNVAGLQVAWTYHSGDFSTGTDQHGPTALQVSPLVVDDRLYFCTPFNRVIALDPETGVEQWSHDPQVDLTGVYTPTCRGVAYWQDSAPDAGQEACQARIFTGTLDARLIALDAASGQPCEAFGDRGTVNLLDGLGEVQPAEYYMTSPPLVVGDHVITGAFVLDGQRVEAPGGAVRAFDARSGELLWVWDPVPPGWPAVTAEDLRQGATLTRGTPNAWALLSANPELGLVYVPTGNPSPDHYAGEEREGRDYYGSSVVALDAGSGEVVWHFQTVRRDLWDYDVAAQPVTYLHHGRQPAVIVATKLGHVFLLDGRTGEPLFPIEERPVPQTRVPGERSAPAQPFPTRPVPLHPQRLDRADVWGLTPWDRRRCRQYFDRLDYQGIYTPPSLRGSLAYPGLGGGINWGSVSVDPGRQRMVVNVQVAPFTVQLVSRDGEASPAGGDQVGYNPQLGTPYGVARDAFLSPWQTPCVPPPWGMLVAVDLAHGEILWQRPLGTLNKLAPFGDRLEWGTPNSGGSIQTASELVFIGATMDHYFRAFDAATGEQLWRYELPYAGHATPVTYRLRPEGRQYVVIAAGGHGPLGTPPGDALIAFALPDPAPSRR